MVRKEIMEFLPHREPMLLVDQMEVDENNVAHARYTVTGEEFFLKGHFPDYPVVPGVILCEIMGQCCSLLVKEHLVGRTPFYAGMDKVRFKRQVRPGDTIEVRGYITKQKAMVFFVNAEARVDGELCAQGILSFALVQRSGI
ncbi:MAG: 3-hydroxyacyl-ACP dehydratase FabZ [Bacteroidales bacterium]|jgi:3-hydroxyacyl-[acyl-carrier-protein] dehydratase|nr:3-hydroxyacyl-ACP dehydratase FabZ [Bacteroidales bacterium]MDD2264701.1 3-hydroxyacyl-ACP dehydratase FabZ [Bacteroidales bacterium]MDD2832177.1 3-hydroxyacyl-ACP dehydratase FabZ [Bacteroidales bacterium]MDD3209072.1 3-hydroxyacyl-ACP dehydratase FabZ [Bacteroidales bacterium]MDD3697920.1 3-hydroxyacyl-ACP dehydratase FabZ [Bacteroidales bacterium]